MVGYVLIVVLLMAAIGWDIFLIDETYTCDPGLDCFTSGIPVQNCSVLYDPAISNVTGDPTVVCFKFAFDYVLAASAIGGLVTFARGVISFIASVNIRIGDRLFEELSKCPAIVCMVVFQTVSMLIMASLVIATTVMQVKESPLKFTRVHSYLQLVTVLVTEFFALFVPWYLLPKEYARSRIN